MFSLTYYKNHDSFLGKSIQCLFPRFNLLLKKGSTGSYETNVTAEREGRGGGCTCSEVFTQLINLFFGYYDPVNVCFPSKKNNFPGDETDIPAITATLVTCCRNRFADISQVVELSLFNIRRPCSVAWH